MASTMPSERITRRRDVARQHCLCGNSEMGSMRLANLKKNAITDHEGCNPACKTLLLLGMGETVPDIPLVDASPTIPIINASAQKEDLFDQRANHTAGADEKKNTCRISFER